MIQARKYQHEDKPKESTVELRFLTVIAHKVCREKA